MLYVESSPPPPPPPPPPPSSFFEKTCRVPHSAKLLDSFPPSAWPPRRSLTPRYFAPWSIPDLTFPRFLFLFFLSCSLLRAHRSPDDILFPAPRRDPTILQCPLSPPRPSCLPLLRSDFYGFTCGSPLDPLWILFWTVSIPYSLINPPSVCSSILRIPSGKVLPFSRPDPSRVLQ